MPRNEFGSPGLEECHARFPRDVPAEITNPLLGPGGIAENQKNTKKDSNVLLFRKPGRHGGLCGRGGSGSQPEPARLAASPCALCPASA